MKLQLQSLLMVFVIAVSCDLKAASREADVAWKKVQSAMNGVLKGGDRSLSQNVQAKRMASAFEAFDMAMKEFLDKAPGDPRRWEAILFDANYHARRGNGGLPAPDLIETLDKILNAPDADVATKREASVRKLTSTWVEWNVGKVYSAEWAKAAEQHLQAYPDPKENQGIKARLDSVKVVGNAISKPIDLKFTAADGSEVDLAKMRGKVVLLHFWNLWDKDFTAEIPKVLGPYLRQHPNGFEVVGISLVPDKPRVKTIVREKEIGWAQNFDGKNGKNDFAESCGVQAPTTWLLDKKGMVVGMDVLENLEAEVVKLLAE